jgi:signal peptidase I
VTSIPTNAAPEAAEEAPALINGRALIEILVMLLIVGLVARAALQIYTVSDRTMSPTIDADQTLLVSRLTFQLRPPQRGELVLVNAPNAPNQQIVRRVIGLPGDVVELRGERDGIEGIQVAVNGRPMIEPYVTTLLQNSTIVTATSRLELGIDEFYVMNDNRTTTEDSRTWGPVGRSSLAGRAWIAVLPLDALRVLDHDVVKIVGE